MERADQLHRPKTDDEEQQTFNGSSNGRHYGQNGGNGRHPKKKKEKEKPVKIQQRGRGVAELEKQRILDEQINEGVVIPSTPVNTPPRAKKLLNRSASVPLRPPFFTRTQSPYYWAMAWDDHFAYVRDNPHLNFGHQNPMQLTSVQNGISGLNEFFSTEGSGSNQMNSEYTRESDKLTRSANNLRTSSLQLGNQQSYFYSPSMANHLAASSSSAVMNFQTEPPSNQSHFGTNRSVHPDEAEKIAGTRQHILYQQDPHDPVACCKYNPFTAPHSLGRSTSFGTQGSFATNGTPTLREGLLCSMSMPNFHLMKDTRTNSATSDGGFLTVGSAETMCLHPNSKSKQALSYAYTAQQPEPTKHYSATYQVQGQSSNSREPSISINHLQHQGQHPIPMPASSNAQLGQSTVSSTHNNNNGDTEDNLDLSLKL